MSTANETPEWAGDLTFRAGDVRVLLAHARAAKEHRPSYEDLFEPDYHKGGKVKEKDGWPDSDNIDPTKIPAGLWLVKDDGVYLMSNGSPALLREEGKPNNVVVYASEANPKTSEDCWGSACSIMGGDDCVITLPATMFTKVDELADDDLILMDVTEESIGVRFHQVETAPVMGMGGANG